MYSLGILIALLGNGIAVLGFVGLLTKPLIFVVSALFFLSVIVMLAKRQVSIGERVKFFIKTSTNKAISLLLLAQITINVIGTVGPEIQFDALWYHLTLPKIFIQRQKIEIFPNTPFFHSALPKLVEMLFIPALAIDSDLLTRFIHLLFGCLTAITIIVYGQKYIGIKAALLAGLIFYSDLSVGWLSQTAYIDLGRTFFETLAFFSLLEWWQKKSAQSLVKIGIFLGIALATKTLALGSLAIVSFVVALYAKTKKAYSVVIICLIAMSISGVWYIRSYQATGNPIYPIFSPHLAETKTIYAPKITDFFLDFFRLSNAPMGWDAAMSPLYLLLLPISLILTRRQLLTKLIGVYCLLGYSIWFFIPRVGGTRFILPYLPAFALLSVNFFLLKTGLAKKLQNVAMVFIFLVSTGNGIIRAYIVKPNLNLLLGRETAHEYLAKRLNYNHVFFDLDYYFEKTIKPTDMVYIVGGHSYAYANFPYVHESFYKGEPFNYILTHNAPLPEKFSSWNLIYENQKTKVKLYSR